MTITRLLISFINIVASIVVALLGLRFVLRLFGASTEAGFVSWLMETTQPLLAPFAGAFPSPVIENGMVLEISALFAIIIYSLIAYLLVELIRFIDDVTRTRYNR